MVVIFPTSSCPLVLMLDHFKLFPLKILLLENNKAFLSGKKYVCRRLGIMMQKCYRFSQVKM